MHALLRYSFLVITGGFAGILCTNSAGAMEAPPENVRAERLPEEITVTGQKMFRVLDQQIRAAEDAMYNIFNDINDDDRYDIHCIDEAPLGTRIKQRVCKPGFVIDSETLNAQDYIAKAQGFASANPPPVQAEIAFGYPVLEEKMKDAVRENPDLLEAVTRHYELREELKNRKSNFFSKE